MAVETFFTSADGVRLYIRIDGPKDGSPVLCLPGLTRNSRDFEALTETLIHDPRALFRVIRMDLRGRGKSASADPSSYRPDVEASDVIAGLDHLGIARPAVVGTSRGGIIAMILAATQAERLGPVVLNDIGPAIDIGGLLNIQGRMRRGTGRMIASWSEAEAGLKFGLGAEFPALSPEDWSAFARQIYRDDNGRPVLDYDPKLIVTMDNLDPVAGLPTMWPLFDALAGRPLMAVRGALSDLLSEATLCEMQARRPDMVVHQVAGEGHAPMLRDPASRRAIADFLFKSL